MSWKYWKLWSFCLILYYIFVAVMLFIRTLYFWKQAQRWLCDQRERGTDVARWLWRTQLCRALSLLHGVSSTVICRVVKDDASNTGNYMRKQWKYYDSNCNETICVWRVGTVAIWHNSEVEEMWLFKKELSTERCCYFTTCSYVITDQPLKFQL